ncbi:hypothetical protein MYX64_11760, partial [Nitrospinae bacterium AH_259_B05_G02_I21]|nr:hypothetical protein [Nitrospinae bacterium AH_259_B05_G02_I21]
AYRFGLYGHEWYGIGIFALAKLVLLAHLLAIAASLMVYGLLKGLGSFRHGRRVLEVVRPFEMAVFIAFLYINFIYFNIFALGIQFSLGVGGGMITRIKTLIFFLASGLSVFLFYRYKARTLKFLETRISTLGRVAMVSLVAALVLYGGRIAYTYGEKSCANPSPRVVQSYAHGQTNRQRPNIIVLTYDGLSAE